MVSDTHHTSRTKGVKGNLLLSLVTTHLIPGMVLINTVFEAVHCHSHSIVIDQLYDSDAMISIYSGYNISYGYISVIRNGLVVGVGEGGTITSQEIVCVFSDHVWVVHDNTPPVITDQLVISSPWFGDTTNELITNWSHILYHSLFVTSEQTKAYVDELVV